MTKEEVFEILLDALKDSAIAFGVILVIHIILSFFELSLAKRLKKNNKLSPLFGSFFGIIPQCGISVIASDLYIKGNITMGTLVSIFLACSDEALPLLLASNKAIYVIFILIIKVVVGFSIGFLIDIIYKEKKYLVLEVKEDLIHTGCCHHNIDDEKENKLSKNLLHPLLHSLKIFLYVLVINIAFGFIIHFINLEAFLNSNKYLAPLFATFVGIIPNCASSVVLSEMFLLNHISFGALMGGLLMNSGLGLVYLLKNKKILKKTFIIIGICFLTAIIFSYLICIITGF